jgi:Cdc6-like AAA superfamily ATPase
MATSPDSESLQSIARARLNQVAGGKVPYNAMAGGSVGPGGSGKTQTHRSVMNEPFDSKEERHSTVGADKMILEVRQTKTNMLDLQRAEVTSLLERAIRTDADSTSVNQDRCIEDLVSTNAQLANVSEVLIVNWG